MNTEQIYGFDEGDRLAKGGLTESDREFLTEYRRTLPPERKGDLFTEGLYAVLEIAREKKKPGTALSDLVAEGNLGLTEALYGAEDGAEEPEPDAESTGTAQEKVLSLQILKDRIRSQIDRYYDELARTKETDGKLAAQVELLSETIDGWLRDYGEKPTVDELANALGVTQERILDILKLSGDEPKDEA